MDKRERGWDHPFLIPTTTYKDIFIYYYFFKSYLIGCSVSIERNAHLVVALVLAGESDACSQRYLHSSQVSYWNCNECLTTETCRCERLFKCAHLCAHDAVASIEMWSIHVHRAPFPFGHAPSTTWGAQIKVKLRLRSSSDAHMFRL